MLDALKIIAAVWLALALTYGILGVVLIVSRWVIAFIRRMLVRPKVK